VPEDAFVSDRARLPLSVRDRVASKYKALRTSMIVNPVFLCGRLSCRFGSSLAQRTAQRARRYPMKPCNAEVSTTQASQDVVLLCSRKSESAHV